MSRAESGLSTFTKYFKTMAKRNRDDELIIWKWGQMARSRGLVGASQSRSGSSGPANAEVLTYITGLTTALSSAQVTRLDTFVTSVKTALSITSLSAAFDTMWILAGETEESSLKNLVSNNYHCTKVNTPAYTAFEGFTSVSGTGSYLNTNFILSTHASKFAAGDAALGIYSRTNSDGNVYDMGAVNATTRQTGIRLRLSNTCYARVLSDSSSGVSNANSLGMLIAEKTSTTNVNVYKNGVFVAADTNGNRLLSEVSISIGCINNAGTPASYSPRQISLLYFSKVLGAIPVAAITTAFEVYMDANGKGVI